MGGHGGRCLRDEASRAIPTLVENASAIRLLSCQSRAPTNATGSHSAANASAIRPSTWSRISCPATASAVAIGISGA